MSSNYTSEKRHPGESDKHLTSVDLSLLDWSPNENLALVNVKTKAIAIGSDNKEFLYKCLDRMTDKHPLWGKLRIVCRFS